MEFRILGPLEVLAAGGEALSLGSAQQRAVLAVLLIQAGEPVSRNRLIDELWGERPPATAEHAVQVHVSGIRKILHAGDGEATLRSSPAGYALDVDPERIDAKRFERLVSEAHAVMENASRARELLEQALSLWRGPPLAELGHFGFAAREADRLDELRAGAAEGVVEARITAGEHAEVVGQITGLVAANPLRERPQRLLMLALYRCGRHAEALAAYREACAALDEIGLQPGPELRHLQEAILRHDPSLGGPQSGADAGFELTIGVARPTPSQDATVTTIAPGGADPEARERQEVSPPVGRRKVITALFCDVAGSTALGEELDPEALLGVLNRYWQELRAVIERHGGTVDRFLGDALMAVFGIPRVNEDDALRAVRAAVEIRECLPTVAEKVGVPLSFRIAVNTGLVLAGEGENLAIGDAVNVAARLEQAAAPGEILLGHETLRLVRDAVQVEPLEPLVLKGKSAPVSAYRLLSVEPHAPGLKRHLEARLVGRERELGLLRAAWQRTLDDRGCHLYTLMGVAGVGKSRLVSELFASLGDSAWVLSGRCLHYGEGITFWPLIEALARIGDPAQGVLDRLGSGGAAAPEELFWAVRQLLESLAVDRSVILHIEDLQWAQPMLFDLIDHVADLSRGAPILLLCTARPDLLEDRPGWGGGKLNATTMLLEPLAATEAEELLHQISDGLDADARSRIVGAAGGNPLFLEEMVALAHELGTIEVPSTIQALLAARLEQLPNEERELLECGAIEGDVFHPTAVRALASERLTAELQPRLAALVRKELIRPHPPSLEGSQAFRFRHILLRDAAYDALPKATRAELHERFATWTEQNARELPELDEIVGWHLQQAVRYRRELGPVDDDYVLLADRAGDCLAAAGRRAMSRGDASAAVSLLRGSAGAFEAAGHTPSEVLLELGSALGESGQLREAEDQLRIALEQALSTGAEAVAARAMIELSDLHSVLDSQARVAESEEVAKRAIAVFNRIGDQGGLARAWLHIADVHWTRCCFARMEEVLEQALVHAERAGIRREQSRILTHFARAAVMGPRPVDDAVTRCNAILARADDDIYLSGMTETMLAVLEAMQGRSDAARDRWQSIAQRLEDIGLNVTVALLQIYRALIELLSEGPVDIEPDLAETCALLQRMGERSRLASAAALLARLLYVSERYADCARYGQISADAVTPDDVASRILWQGTRAKLLARADDGASAEVVAGDAVSLAEQTDSPLLFGDALRDRAEVRTILNNPDSAIGDLRRAIGLYDRKGIRVSRRLRNAAAVVGSS